MKEKANLSYVHQLSGGDVEFEKKLISLIQRELPIEIEIYRKNIEENNLEAAAGIVHKIKHKISILGLVESHRLADLYENELLEGRNQRSSDFEAILQHMLEFIQQV